MFTGIVTDIGEVCGVEHGDGQCRLSISTSYEVERIETGASIACGGCCLTVTAIDKGRFSVDVSNETLSRTVLGQWQPGTRINLEQSLRIGDELGGHMVSGHVDGVADLVSVSDDGFSRRMVFASPPELSKFIAVKGSVALDGVSLTVNEAENNSFGVNIVPHTLTHTTFGDFKAARKVNLEVDMLSRYVARIIAKEGRNE